MSASDLGMQVGKALLLGLLKIAAEEAQSCHASQYVLHHRLLPRRLQHQSEVLEATISKLTLCCL
ncbi:MAG: hypothetical protein FRX49_07447 [Trebouxia sp. A1-2]|nr:MAG: hypothetical protein FRX49_07447 [Trebouxia sp. A1-2]